MSNRFDIVDTPLDRLKLVRRKPMATPRLYGRMFCRDD
jgi:hypothetical protein